MWKKENLVQVEETSVALHTFGTSNYVYTEFTLLAVPKYLPRINL